MTRRLDRLKAFCKKNTNMNAAYRKISRWTLEEKVSNKKYTLNIIYLNMVNWITAFIQFLQSIYSIDYTLRTHERLSTILKTSKKVYEEMFFDT